MTDSFVMINGVALWWIIGLAVLTFVAFIALGRWCIEESKRNDRLKARIALLICERDEWEGKYLVATYTQGNERSE